MLNKLLTSVTILDILFNINCYGTDCNIPQNNMRSIQCEKYNNLLKQNINIYNENMYYNNVNDEEYSILSQNNNICDVKYNNIYSNICDAKYNNILRQDNDICGEEEQSNNLYQSNNYPVLCKNNNNILEQSNNCFNTYNNKYDSFNSNVQIIINKNDLYSKSIENEQKQSQTNLLGHDYSEDDNWSCNSNSVLNINQELRIQSINKIDDFINNLIQNNIYFINDNIICNAQTIFSKYEINKLLIKFTQMYLDNVNTLMEQRKYNIDSDYIVSHIIKLRTNNLLLDKFNSSIKKFSSKFNNVELFVYNDKNEILVSVFMKSNVLLDRLNYTFTHNDNIALANILNIIYFINNNKNNKEILLKSLKDFIKNALNNTNIINNNVQFLNNFKYFRKYVDGKTRNVITTYIKQNNINNNEILNSIIETMKNKNKLTKNDWNLVFFIIFKDFKDNSHCINVSDNKILIDILNDDIPEEYKITILKKILHSLTQYMKQLSKTSKKTPHEKNDYLPVLEKFLYSLKEEVYYTLLRFVKNTIDYTDDYTKLKSNIIDFLINIIFQQKTTHEKNYINYLVSSIFKNKNNIGNLLKHMNNAPESEYANEFMKGIANNLISTDDNERQQYILEIVFNMSTDNIKQLFIDTIQNSNQINYEVQKNIINYFTNLKNKTSSIDLQNILEHNIDLNINEILSIFWYQHDIKILVDFLNKNYNSSYTKRIVSNIIHFATIDNVVSNIEYNQNFTKHFLTSMNDNLLELFNNVMIEHMKNIGYNQKVLQGRYKTLQYYINNYQNDKKQHFIITNK